MGLVGDGIDIIGQPQGGDIGIKPIDDRPALRARSAMAHAEIDILTGLLFPAGGKGGIKRGIKLAGGIVGDIGDRNRRGSGQRGR